MSNKLFRDHVEGGSAVFGMKIAATTYSVVPVNEECGLIEWVDHTAPYRNILLSLYEKRNLVTTNRKLKELISLSLAPKDLFLKHLLPRYPPVFYEWFIHQFATFEQWYQAKVLFASSAAVFSVLGYIIG